MTGPDHYREAERLLAEAADFPDALLHIDRQGVTPEEAADVKRRFEEVAGNKKTLVTARPLTVDMAATLAAAQVHAMLALAAATAYQAEKDGVSDYLEPPVDADTAIRDNAILARIADAEARIVDAIDWTAERDRIMATIRMDRLTHYRRISDIRMWVLAGLVGVVLWFAVEAWGL